MTTVNDDRMQSPFVWQPQDAAEAWHYKQSLGEESVYVAGGTLLRTQWESGLIAMPKHIIDLGSVSGIKGIAVHGKEVEIGAFTPMSMIRKDPFLLEHYPMLIDAVRVIAAPAVRNLATLGGNITAGVGDSIPALLAYEAELVWYDGQKRAAEPLADWLDDLLHSRAEPGKLLMQVRLPYRHDDPETPNKPFCAYHKIGRRESFTPSLVTVSLFISIDSNQRIMTARIAVGGGQTIPHRLYAAESLLQGKVIDIDLLEPLYEQLLQEFEPSGDLFGSVEYRKRTAANLIAAELWKLTL
jgi:xanthine dehydrogenase C subunit